MSRCRSELHSFPSGRLRLNAGVAPRGGQFSGHTSSVMHWRVTTTLSRISERRLPSLLARGASSPGPTSKRFAASAAALRTKLAPGLVDKLAYFLRTVVAGRGTYSCIGPEGTGASDHDPKRTSEGRTRKLRGPSMDF